MSYWAEYVEASQDTVRAEIMQYVKKTYGEKFILGKAYEKGGYYNVEIDYKISENIKISRVMVIKGKKTGLKNQEGFLTVEQAKSIVEEELKKIEGELI